jgi:CRISPR-associated endonuclease Cas3-HD
MTTPDDQGAVGPFRYLAHSPNANGTGVAEPLSQHLQCVADLAQRFAAAFGAEQQAAAAGLLHDLGKYADQFQRRLRDPRERGRDHWTVGALAALTARQLGLLPSLAIAGHHAGLHILRRDPREAPRELLSAMANHRENFTETDRRLLFERFTADGFRLPTIDRGLVPTGRFAADMLDVRMLFSTLVDADFLETEAHSSGDSATPRRPRPDGVDLDLDRALSALERYLTDVRRQHQDSPIAAWRERLYAACSAAADQPTGPFTLSAPTGTGKTLAMLGFALRHARRHNLGRIVVVLPFLNILDQTAEVYRQIFSAANGFDPNTVLEHHSLADPNDGPSDPGSVDGREGFTRLLVENWDAPVILTTTVQFFESLMADRPSRCRKLHRLARSVILCDEIQTLPISLAVATLATLARLCEPTGPYHTSVVFATATQPAFDTLGPRLYPQFSGAWQPREILPVNDRGPMYAMAAERYRIAWRHTTPIALDDLAVELRQQEQVLCVVNLKRHATGLARVLEQAGTDGVLHLSTNMCPAHRMATLETVNSRLHAGLPVHLVATQCVEAGVDLDFPVVYRALAPLEAIAQAAGRCNRHGRRERGRVVVFQPQDDRRPYPPGYGEGVDATQTYLAALSVAADLERTEVLNSPERLHAYFRHLYRLSGRTDSERDDEQPLLDAIRGGDFPDVATRYKLIGENTIRVLVPYDLAMFEELTEEIADPSRRTAGFVRDWCRRAARYAVNLYRPRDGDPIVVHLDPIQFSHHRETDSCTADWFVALPNLVYTPLTGISAAAENVWIV